MAIYANFQAKEGILSQSADTLKKELLEVLKEKEQVLSKQVALTCKHVVYPLLQDWFVPILGVLCWKWGGNTTTYMYLSMQNMFSQAWQFVFLVPLNFIGFSAGFCINEK